MKKLAEEVKEVPIQKNQEYIVEIIDNGFQGEGIAKKDGFTIFIPNAIKGEKIKVLIVKVLSSHAFGKIVEILEKSPNRVEPDCKTYKRCGGCSLRHIKYEETLRMKQNAVQGLVNKYLKDVKTKILVKEIIGMERPYFYRNKAQYPVGKDKQGNPIMGVFANRTHEIIPIEKCYIQNQKAEEVAKFVFNFIVKNNISIYDEKTGKGLVRHIVTKIGIRTNEIMVILVINGRNLIASKSEEAFESEHASNFEYASESEHASRKPQNNKLYKLNKYSKDFMNLEEKFVNEVISKFPEVKSIVKNINMKNTNVILGNENINLYGNGYIEDKLRYENDSLANKYNNSVYNIEKQEPEIQKEEINKEEDQKKEDQKEESKKEEQKEINKEKGKVNYEFTFKISPLSFYQVNPIQAEKLYKLGVEGAKINKNDIVFDLYCGIGTISIFMSKFAHKVYGVEIVPEAVVAAKENAEINNIKNVEFIAGDVEKVLDDLINKKNIIPNVVMVDPPRRGLDGKSIENLLKINPERIVYISCNPATLVRDLSKLQEKYEIHEIQPVDMFPYTGHVECVSILKKKEV